MEASWFQRQSCHCINDLPDSIIHHILSFLPIKDVIRTSFISKRWRYLWTSVPNLDFDGLVFAPKIKFMRFVDSVLLHRSDSAIQKFSLRFGNYYCNSSHVQTWILTAVSNNVRELSVASHTEEPFELPVRMFTCRSLMVLTLNLYNSILNLPSSIYLPFLKTLRLTSIAFLDDNLIQVLSNCPVLENVHLEDCSIGDQMTLNISSPSLRRLTIDGPPKDVNLYYGFVKNGIRVFAPKLLLFRYSNYFTQSVLLENVLSLVQASISLNFDWDKREQVCGQHLSNFLGGCLSNVKVLTLSSATIGLLSAASDLLRLPTFCRLIHLNVSTAVSNDYIRAVTCFLFNAPNLEFLSISISHRQRWFDKECFEPEKAPFECALNHLKIVKINGLMGDENELVFVKYLLKHASALERMVIVFSKQLSVNSQLQMKIKDNILMHPKASTSSEVSCESMNCL